MAAKTGVKRKPVTGAKPKMHSAATRWAPGKKTAAKKTTARKTVAKKAPSRPPDASILMGGPEGGSGAVQPNT